MRYTIPLYKSLHFWAVEIPRKKPQQRKRHVLPETVCSTRKEAKENAEQLFKCAWEDLEKEGWVVVKLFAEFMPIY